MAEEPKNEKLPIAPLPTTAYTTKTTKKRKTEVEKDIRRKEDDRARNKTRINIGVAFERWRELRELKGFKLDADLAIFLLDRYDQSTSTQVKKKQSSSPAALSSDFGSLSSDHESVHQEYQRVMSSPHGVQPAACAPHSAETGKSGKRDAAYQRLKSGDDWTTTNQSENGDIKEDEDEELSTTLSVGDGRYLVDLGSSSEIIVDEECILQLFKSCRKCSRQCAVRKRVKGLKLVVNQACCFCESRSKWTNLPDEDEDVDFQMNGKDTVHGQSR